MGEIIGINGNYGEILNVISASLIACVILCYLLYKMFRPIFFSLFIYASSISKQLFQYLCSL